MKGIFRKYGLFKRRKRASAEIFPEEILADSRNIPRFDKNQFEGRLERPISRWSLNLIGIVALIVFSVFAGRAWYLQISSGSAYAHEALNNTLRSTPLFATRGIIYDRNGVELAWNVPGPADDPDVARREYASSTGLSQTLGYIQYPSKDSAGFYYQEDFAGEDGAEKYFNNQLLFIK